MVCVLQFDSASLALLERMSAEGRLPSFDALRARGTWLELEAPSTHFAAGAFHTLYSGVELPDHGIFYPFQWSAADQRVRYMSALDPPEAVWDPLARRGLRTLAIDPYESRPPTTEAGTLVCGWQLTDRVVLQPWSVPAGKRAALERLFGAAPPAEEIFGRPPVGELLALRRHLVAAPGRVADAAGRLLDGERYDLAWLTFTAAHLAGHQFWDLSQVNCDDLDGDARAVLEGALEEVYDAVDAALARVIELLPDGTDVIVTSAVGMDVNTSRADMLPEMLDAILHGASSGDSASGFIWRLRAAVPSDLRGRVARALPDRAALELTARLELRGMDWSRTRAFAQPADNQGYVRLNLRGRERDGIVDPGEADALCDEIVAGLESFADPDGAPAVKSVERVAEAFGEGARAGRLPDLVVRWSDRPATRVPGLFSPRFGGVHRRGSASGRAGNHTDGDAWALLCPARGTRVSELARAPRLVDVAATVAQLAGGDASAMPGEPLLERG